MCMCDLILPPRLREIEDRLHGLKAPSTSQTPALKFKVREMSFSLSQYFLNVWYGSWNKWESSHEWLSSMYVCLHTLKEQHRQDGFPAPGCNIASVPFSRLQSSSAPEGGLPFAWKALKEWTLVPYLSLHLAKSNKRENKSKEKKSWGKCVARLLVRSEKTLGQQHKWVVDRSHFRVDSWAFPKTRVTGSVWLQFSGLVNRLGGEEVPSACQGQSESSY